MLVTIISSTNDERIIQLMNYARELGLNAELFESTYSAILHEEVEMWIDSNYYNIDSETRRLLINDICNHASYGFVDEDYISELCENSIKEYSRHI